MEQIKNPVWNESLDGQIGYNIQHIILRDLFYKAPKAFASKISNMFLADLYTEMYVENKSTSPYTLSDFYINKMMIDDNHFLACCELPKPKYTPLCYRIYILFNKDFADIAYFTIEKGPYDNGGYLCSWDAKKNHLNYHQIDDLEWAPEKERIMIAIETRIIVDLYMNR